MDQFQFQKCCNQNAYFLIHKGFHEKVSPVHTLTFCITKPVDKKVKKITFTAPAPTPIQSSSGNVHYKDEASKPL